MSSRRGTAKFAWILAGCLCFGSLLQAATAPEIPAGTEIRVRIIENLSSATARLGDIFHGTLDEPIIVNGKQLFPKGADVTGTIAAVHPSGRLTDPGELNLVLNTISSGGIASSVTVQPYQVKGESHTKSNVTKAGGGAALGAIIGGIVGGGKGAAIGAGAGAAATGKKEAVIESEAVIKFISAGSAATIPAPPEEAKPSSVAPAAADKPAVSTTPKNSFQSAALLTARDRRVIRNCLQDYSSEFPSGALHREELLSGSERQVK